MKFWEFHNFRYSGIEYFNFHNSYGSGIEFPAFYYFRDFEREELKFHDFRYSVMKF